MFTDGQTQACATKLSGRRTIGLEELLENAALLGGVNPDAGIRDLKANSRRRAVANDIYFQSDFTLFGELNRVADQIDQNLAYPPRVPKNTINTLWGSTHKQLNTFISRRPLKKCLNR